MSKMIFVNLPVADLDRSIAFYTALGFARNPQFSDDTAAGMVWSEAIYVMILSHAKWRSFTDRPFPPAGASEVMLSFNCDSRDEVDRLVELAAAHGGTCDANPPQDLGFMYQRTITDPDDHVWEPFWMDPAALDGQPPHEDPAP